MRLHNNNNNNNITIALTIAVFVLSWVATSCQKTPINGDLDGQWQVMSVTPEPEERPIEERLYYCFNLHVCNLTYYGGVFTSGNIQFDDKTLYLDFPYADSHLSIRRLRQYGIDENPITFSVEHLDKKSLILRHGDTVVTMRKF